MSSDFNIPLRAILKTGVVITIEWSDLFNDPVHLMQIPDYPHTRDVSLAYGVNGHELLVSCGGQFVQYFEQWLVDNNVPYELH